MRQSERTSRKHWPWQTSKSRCMHSESRHSRIESLHLRRKNSAQEEIAELCDSLSAHRKQIHQIQQSLGWMLLNRARAVRVD